MLQQFSMTFFPWVNQKGILDPTLLSGQFFNLEKLFVCCKEKLNGSLLLQLNKKV